MSVILFMPMVLYKINKDSRKNKIHFKILIDTIFTGVFESTLEIYKLNSNFLKKYD